MRTSCRFAMAVHVLAILAYKAGEPVTSALLAASINTNPVIIRRLLLALQEAHLVQTRKGAGFGSRLVRPPERIRLLEIYRAVERDDPFTMPRRKPDRRCPVGQCVQAELEKVFLSAQAALEHELSKTTLARVLSALPETELSGVQEAQS